MKTKSMSARSLLLALAAQVSLTGCTLGALYDTSGNGLEGVEVTAYADCTGPGCAAAEVETATPTGALTGYRVASDSDGHYFFDPYGEMVDAGMAMAVTVPEDSPEDYYRIRFSKDGYRDVWIDYAPEFERHSNESSDYYLSRVPSVFLCRKSEIDTDGDGICDRAELHYGTSPERNDTDGDGEYDDQELYGSGSPLAVQTRKLLHYNINVSDFDVSKAFYEMLGFVTLLDVQVDVSDPAEAQGLDLPPYSLRAAPMMMGGPARGGFIIDLIRFKSPYDPTPPHGGVALGLAQLHMRTENLPQDMALLAANGIAYAVTVGTEQAPEAIEFADPDGVPIHLAQHGPVRTGRDYRRSIPGPTIFVSDLERSIAFYHELGFLLREVNTGSAELYLSNRRSLRLVETDSEIPAYEKLNHLGIARLAIATTNIDRDIAVLEAAGVEFYTPQAILPSGPLAFLRYVCFEDPDGTVIELVE